MKKMTSAGANKVLKKLKEEKEFWTSREKERQIYVAELGEEPVIPDYDYAETARKISEIDEKIMRIKHAVNYTNINNSIIMDGAEITIDMALVRMAQLSSRKAALDIMRRRQPKARINDNFYGRKQTPEYQYVNYDLETVKKDYEKTCSDIIEMQLALDRYNQTVEFDVDI